MFYFFDVWWRTSLFRRGPESRSSSFRRRPESTLSSFRRGPESTRLRHSGEGRNPLVSVIPAKAGIHSFVIPAKAGIHFDLGLFFRSVFSAIAITDSRPCAFRPPSMAAGYFLLLAQKKVTKRKRHPRIRAARAASGSLRANGFGRQAIHGLLSKSARSLAPPALCAAFPFALRRCSEGTQEPALTLALSRDAGEGMRCAQS